MGCLDLQNLGNLHRFCAFACPPRRRLDFDIENNATDGPTIFAAHTLRAHRRAAGSRRRRIQAAAAPTAPERNAVRASVARSATRSRLWAASSQTILVA